MPFRMAKLLDGGTLTPTLRVSPKGGCDEVQSAGCR